MQVVLLPFAGCFLAQKGTLFSPTQGISVLAPGFLGLISQAHNADVGGVAFGGFGWMFEHGSILASQVGGINAVVGRYGRHPAGVAWKRQDRARYLSVWMSLPYPFGWRT